MKRAHAQRSPRQLSRQSSDNVLSVPPPIPPPSIISTSSQCHFPKLPLFSFTSQLPSPGIRSSWPERLPRYTVSLPVSAYQALDCPVGSSASSVVTAPFLVCREEHSQAKCILPGDAFPSAGLSRPPESKRMVERCPSLFKGRAIAECAPASRLLSSWITEIGELRYSYCFTAWKRLYGPASTYVVSVILLSQREFDTGSLFLQLCPSHSPLFELQLGESTHFS